MPRFRLPPYRVENVTAALFNDQRRDLGHELTGIPRYMQRSRGAGVNVAILDTGCQMDHPDLAARIIGSRDFTGSPFGVDDRAGHGTHCAGIIAAEDNEFGVVGVAPQARLIIGKVLGDDGSGQDTWVANGVRWAADSMADIISMSLGSPQPSPQIRDAIRYAVSRGKYVICAAGNAGPGPNTIGYPARYAEVIAVGAVDAQGKPASFSSRGEEIDIAAPGVSVISTYPGNQYATLSGTSMATPHVAGVAALLLSVVLSEGRTRPTPAEAIRKLQQWATDIGSPGHDNDTGWGLARPDGVIPVEAPTPPIPDPPSPPPTDPEPPWKPVPTPPARRLLYDVEAQLKIYQPDES